MKTWMRWFVTFLVCVPPLMGQGLNPEWRAKLSQPQYEDIRFRMYQVPMPDGTKIGVAVWTPDVEGQKFPTILIATPYNKLSDADITDAGFFVPRGYAYVAYDLRGRYDSEGEAYLYGE